MDKITILNYSHLFWPDIKLILLNKVCFYRGHSTVVIPPGSPAAHERTLWVLDTWSPAFPPWYLLAVGYLLPQLHELVLVGHRQGVLWHVRIRPLYKEASEYVIQLQFSYVLSKHRLSQNQIPECPTFKDILFKNNIHIASNWQLETYNLKHWNIHTIKQFNLICFCKNYIDRPLGSMTSTGQWVDQGY